MFKKIVLITTGQPSVNPRVVKEADALQAAGHNVTVLYCFWIQWAENADKSILNKAKWNYKLIGGSPFKNKFLYFFTKARFKVFKELNKRFGNRFLFAQRSQARCFDELLQAAKSIKADWYIGHNLGALPVAVKAAVYNGTAAGFDFEDYHREENADMPMYEKERVVFLEKKYVPRLSYISSAGNLITERIKQNFPAFSKPVVTVLNCFSLSQRSLKAGEENNDGLLHLFWFSQTIGKNRGLETAVEALEKLNNNQIHLTLAGRYDPEMQQYINEHGKSLLQNIHIAGIIEPDALPAFAAQFDIGLAAELSTPLNRDICLTNKIFTYLLAGNCILASDTAAQKDFMESYPGIGLVYKNNEPNDFAYQLKKLFDDRNLLNQYKKNARMLAQTHLNWEMESQKLLKIVG